MFSIPTGLVLGALLGIRHALEPDHLAAVSTLVSRQRDPRAGAIVGALWGVGHTLSLLAVAVVLHVLHAELPAKLAVGFELAVALMLIGLGARALGRAWRLGTLGPRATHHHGRLLHTHDGHTDHVHVGSLTLARKPLLIGLMHGLAGSGALTALAFANVSTTHARFWFIALFGLGSILGMAALTGLAGWPIAHFSRREGVSRSLMAITGALSLAIGIVWIGKALQFC